jgi:hypothetical protein
MKLTQIENLEIEMQEFARKWSEYQESREEGNEPQFPWRELTFFNIIVGVGFAYDDDGIAFFDVRVDVGDEHDYASILPEEIETDREGVLHKCVCQAVEKITKGLIQLGENQLREKIRDVVTLINP